MQYDEDRKNRKVVGGADQNEGLTTESLAQRGDQAVYPGDATKGWEGTQDVQVDERQDAQGATDATQDGSRVRDVPDEDAQNGTDGGGRFDDDRFDDDRPGTVRPDAVRSDTSADAGAGAAAGSAAADGTVGGQGEEGPCCPGAMRRSCGCGGARSRAASWMTRRKPSGRPTSSSRR